MYKIDSRGGGGLGGAKNRSLRKYQKLMRPYKLIYAQFVDRAPQLNRLKGRAMQQGQARAPTGRYGHMLNF